MTDLEMAQAAHDARQWLAAADAYERHLAATGDSAVLLALGDVSAEVGRFDRARDAYAALAGSEGPQTAVAAARLGGLELRRGRWDAARNAFRRAYATGFAPAAADLEPRTPEPDGVSPPLTETAHAPPAVPAAARARGNASNPSSPAKVFVGVFANRAEAGGSQEEDGPVKLSFQVFGAGAVDGSERGWELQLPGGVQAERRLLNRLLDFARGSGADVVVATEPETAKRLLQLDWFEPLAGFASAAGADGGFAGLRIRGRVLAEFSGLDAVYDGMEAAVADLMARARRAGFNDQSGLVGAEFRLKAYDLDSEILRLRYPERARAGERVQGRAWALAERLHIALEALPGRLLLDMSPLRPHFDGISEVARSLAAALEAEGTFELHLLCDPEAARFHGLDRFAAAGRLTVRPSPGDYTACLRVAQPFDTADLERTWAAAPVAGFLMHDPITLDCGYAAAGLESVWRRLFAHSELIGFVSRFSEEQFARRFDLPEAPGRFVALNSTSVDDYGGPNAAAAPGGGLLVVGNAFPHKNLMSTVLKLREALPEVEMVVLGVGRPAEPGLKWLRSGDLTPEEVNGLYENCGVVVYPSFYEGFGLPIMHALAHGRPVMALSQPAYREIKAASRFGDAVHLFDTTDALVGAVARVLRDPPPSPRTDVREQRWTDAAKIIAVAVQAAVADFRLPALRARLADSLECAANMLPLTPASKAPKQTLRTLPIGARLYPGEVMRQGGCLLSPTGLHALHFQLDGNLVLYAMGGGTPHLALWAAGELPKAEVLTLDAEGRLELRDGAGEALWSVKGKAGAWLEVRPGRLVLADAASVSWEVPALQEYRPQPAYQRRPGVLPPGDQLTVGARLASRTGSHQLVMAVDGLLVEAAEGGAAWSVSFERAARLIMQDDGNLVAYASGGEAVWSTGTAGHDGAHARLDNVGALVVELAEEVLWSRAG